MSTQGFTVVSSHQVFPTRKWKAYVSACRRLSTLKEIKRSAENAIEGEEVEVESLRLELVEALEQGAIIEKGGRIG